MSYTDEVFGTDQKMSGDDDTIEEVETLSDGFEEGQALEKEEKKARKRLKILRSFKYPRIEENPYGPLTGYAQQAREILPKAAEKIRPTESVAPLDLPELNKKDDVGTWTWRSIRALGTTPEKQRTQEEKLPREFADAADQFASARHPFALSCVGKPGAGVSFRIGVPADTDVACAEDVLRAAFGIAELSEEPDALEQKPWQQAVCDPVRLDTDSLDKIEQNINPGKWADEAAAIVSGSDCAVCLAFFPVDKNWIDLPLKESLDMDDALTHYLKDTQQLSSNYGLSGNGSRSSTEKLLGKEKLLDMRDKNFTDSISGGYSLSQGVSLNVETRDFQAEQMQNSIRNRIRLLEQMKVHGNGWTVRITVHADSLYQHAAIAVRGALGAALTKLGYACDWETHNHYGVQKRNSMILPGFLLPALISFPSKSYIGFELKPRTNLNLNPTSADEDKSIPIGSLVWNGKTTQQQVRIPKKDINRHMFVCGKTGSGKSNTVTSFITAMNERDALHCMVIEPVKGEYHALPGMHRYTMIAGDEHCLQMNPFWFPAGSSLQYHIDSLKLIISSAFDLYAAMPNILEQCLYRVYVNCGWDFVSGKNMYAGQLPHEYLYPTFRSLCDEIELYLDESDFGGELRGNYEGALLSRLKSFTSGVKGMLLNTTRHIPVQDWSQKNVVVELDALADDSDKAIVMGALLIQYFQYVKYCQEHKGTDGLKHLFVLEEAHHLFKEKAPTSSSSGEGSGGSSSTHLVEMLNDLLAEARAYGEGFIIVDQSPSSISASVLKNTGVKIVHRVDYGEDVSMLQKVLLLEENDRTTASLKVGHALIRYGEMFSPAEVQIPLCDSKEGSIMHKRISELSAQDNAYDRILTNDEVMDTLKEETRRFLNQILSETNTSTIQFAYSHFREVARRLIAHKCGTDSERSLSATDYYPPVLEVCALYQANQMFPGHYCLARAITMFMIRLARILGYYDRQQQGEFDSISSNECFKRDWEMLENYRVNFIYPRMMAFYSSSGEAAVNLWSRALQGIERVVPDYPILYMLAVRVADYVTETDVQTEESLTLTEKGEEEFSKALVETLYVKPSLKKLNGYRQSTLAYLSFLRTLS